MTDPMSIEPTQADMAYAKSIVEAVEHGCTYEDRCLTVRDLLARHRLASAPASGEVVAWQRRRMWPLDSDAPGKVYQWHECRAEEATGHFDKTPGYEYRALYAAPVHPAADLVEALREARAALHFHYVEWDGEPEDAVPLQLARAKCDAALSRYAKGGA